MRNAIFVSLKRPNLSSARDVCLCGASTVMTKSIDAHIAATRKLTYIRGYHPESEGRDLFFQKK